MYPSLIGSMVESEEERVVKLGRKPLVPPLSYHWALQIGEKWYEIAPMKETRDGNKIDTNFGKVAASTAGTFGWSVVGETQKTDKEIDEWNKDWLAEHPEYFLLTENCQKYVFELMKWVTDNNYRSDLMLDSGIVITTGEEYFVNDGFVVETDGTQIASYIVGQSHDSVGPLNVRTTVGEFTAEVNNDVAGSGLGVFVDATFAEAEFSAGNLAGASVGLNADTGIGIRGGNAEAHVLGFGFEVGADGVQVDTPLIGARICCNIL